MSSNFFRKIFVSEKFRFIITSIICVFLIFLTIRSDAVEAGEDSGRKELITLKVMSFNIWDYQDNSNHWYTKSGSSRKDKVIKTIEKHDPDVIGFQEDIELQINDIHGAFNDTYKWYGIGSIDGEKEGRFNSIFYRKDRFTCIAKGTIWLSDTPHIPGSKFANAYFRTGTWLKLFDKKISRTYFFLNAHWCNGPQHARDGSAMIFRKLVPALAGDLPVVITGDLNTEEDSKAYRILLGKDTPESFQLYDTYRVLNPERKEEEGTYHSFGGNSKGPRIDYIICNGLFKPVESVVDRKPVDNHWASDHFALIAVLEILIPQE